MTDVVSIKTGKPVISARKEASDRREALIRDGKRWQYFVSLLKAGAFTVKGVGQELDFDNELLPYIDEEIDKADKQEIQDKRHQKYLKSKE